MSPAPGGCRNEYQAAIDGWVEKHTANNELFFARTDVASDLLAVGAAGGALYGAAAFAAPETAGASLAFATAAMAFVSEALEFDPNGPSKIDKGVKKADKAEKDFKEKCRALKRCADTDGAAGEAPDKPEDELAEQAARAAVRAYKNQQLQGAMDKANAERAELLDDLVETGAIGDDEVGEVDDLMEGSWLGFDVGGNIARFPRRP